MLDDLPGFPRRRAAGDGSVGSVVGDDWGAVAADIPDEIHFDVDGTGLHSIAPRTALPPITEAVVINGYTSSEGEADHNQKLSEDRAKAVQAALGKLIPKTLTSSAVGHGA